MDPFDRFAQEEISWNTLREHGSRLAREAAELLAQHSGGYPDELAGLIVLPDTSLWPTFVKLLSRTAGPDAVPPGPFVGVTMRSFVEDFAGPTFSDFCAEDAPAFGGRLPVACTTKDGFRFASFEIPELGG